MVAFNLKTTEVSASGFGPLLLYVALFILSGPSLILLQKYVLGVLYFEYPIAIVAVGNFVRWALILVLVHTGIVDLGAHKDLTFVVWFQTEVTPFYSSIILSQHSPGRWRPIENHR